MISIKHAHCPLIHGSSVFFVYILDSLPPQLVQYVQKKNKKTQTHHVSKGSDHVLSTSIEDAKPYCCCVYGVRDQYYLSSFFQMRGPIVVFITNWSIVDLRPYCLILTDLLQMPSRIVVVFVDYPSSSATRWSCMSEHIPERNRSAVTCVTSHLYLKGYFTHINRYGHQSVTSRREGRRDGTCVTSRLYLKEYYTNINRYSHQSVTSRREGGREDVCHQ